MAKKANAKPATTNYTDIGYNLGIEFSKADILASNTKKQAIVSVLSKNLEESQFKIVLEGFEKYMIEAGFTSSTIKVRKSELNTCFSAILKTEVSEKNFNALRDFDGHYNQFIELARKLKNEANAQNGEVTPKPPKVKTDFTDSQKQALKLVIDNSQVLSDDACDIAQDMAEKMPISQVHTLLQNQSTRLDEEKQLILVESIFLNMVENEHVELALKEFARKQLIEVTAMIDKIQTARKEAEKVQAELSQPFYMQA